MQYLLVLSAVIFAVLAMPADVDREVDLGKESDILVEMPADTDHELDFGEESDVFDSVAYLDGAFTTPNLTDARVPAGQLGFAATGGGTQGGSGGAQWTVWDGWALRDAIRGNDRRIVNVRGRIDLTALFANSPGVRLDVGSFKTIVGSDRNAMIFGGGLRITNARQVIIDNIRFHNALNYAPGERPNGNGGIASMVPGAFSSIDALEITTSEYVWVNHCEFADDPWNSASTPENMRRHDGLIDIVRGSNWISISNSLFRNHNMVTLVGNGDGNGSQDRNRLKVTFYLNWYQGVSQRNPRVRFGEVHVLNNLYTDIRSYGIGLGVEARVYAERNAFINSRRAWGWASGVPNPRGYLLNDNNRLANSAFDSGITANGVTWRPANHYRYTAMNQNNVEAHVRRWAGPR